MSKAPTFPAFVRLETKGTDDAKASFQKAVDQIAEYGERRTRRLSGDMQANLEKALSIDASARNAFTTDIDRALTEAMQKTGAFAAAARRNLEAALSGKVSAGGLDIDVAGAKEAAAVLERRALIARQLAEVTQASAVAEGQFTQATRLSIAATKELAENETQAAAAARVQAEAAEKLQAALVRAGVTTHAFGAANDNLNRTSGAARQGMLQLGYQVSDAATMFSLGSNASQIFASQLGQTVQAVQLLTGGTSRLAGFLAGPWGVALSTAAIVAAPFIGKLWETYSAANAATGALEGLIKKQRQQQAEKNVVPNAQKDLKALEKRRDELEAEIRKRGVRNPATGQLQFVYKQQAELKQVYKDLAEGRQALDNERASAVSLDKTMGDLAAKRLKDAYATEKQTKAKTAKVKVDKDEFAELNKALAAEIASIQKFAGWNEKALGLGLDRGTAGMFEAMAANQRKATDDLIKAADANGAWNDQLAESIALLGQLGGAASALANVGAAITALRSADYSGIRGPAGVVLKSVGSIGWTEMDSSGNRTIKLLGEEIITSLDKVFGARGSFGKTLEAAGLGSAASQLALGTKGGNIGSLLGGALGKEAGQALFKGVGGMLGKLGGPLGSIAGGILGGALGSAFKKTTSGYAVLSRGGVQSGGSNADLARGAANTGDSINSKLTTIAERLGGMVGDYSVSIGTRSSGWISVSASGSSQVADKNWKKRNVGGDLIYDGKDAEEAARIALLNAVQDGAIKGIRQGAQRLLQSGKDLDRQLQRALDFQGVFTSLKGYRDPVGAALDTLNLEFRRLQEIFAEAGASVSEYADLEALYGIRRAEAIDQANDKIIGSLKDLQRALSVGNETLSLRDRNSAALAIYNPLAERVKAGDVTAYDKFTQAAQDLLDINRQLYGSTSAFFDVQNEVKALLDGTIAKSEAASAASSASDSPFSQLATQQQATANAIDAQTTALIAALESKLGTRLDNINSNLIASSRAAVANGNYSSVTDLLRAGGSW